MRRIIAPLALTAAAALLSGCVVMPDLGGVTASSPAPTATPSAEPTHGVTADSCDGGRMTINQPGDHVIGDCDELTLEGNGVDVKTGAIGTLIIRGTDIDVEAASIGAIEIAGQNNDVESRAAVGGITIAGDDNDVEVIGDIGSVTINGNENDVDASGRIGAITDNGTANDVRGAQP